MANEKWNHVEWKCDGSDNNLIREFLAGPDNEGNCNACPYRSGQYHCWVALS